MATTKTIIELSIEGYIVVPDNDIPAQIALLQVMQSAFTSKDYSAVIKLATLEKIGSKQMRRRFEDAPATPAAPPAPTPLEQAIADKTEPKAEAGATPDASGAVKTDPAARTGIDAAVAAPTAQAAAEAGDEEGEVEIWDEDGVIADTPAPAPVEVKKPAEAPKPTTAPKATEAPKAAPAPAPVQVTSGPRRRTAR